MYFVLWSGVWSGLRGVQCSLCQVENVSGTTAEGVSGDWSEVAVPVPFIKTFSSSWFYTFTTLQSATVYDVVGQGNQPDLEDIKDTAKRE